ncbi:MAG: hypothetical protein EZS28_039170 [Streblomastix strix]|uniref:Uncharacterized protein n=1 Tax=Streblomastix strix TaxID=222440 RepID=A0A5J4U4Z6_9EUKA|nr:MAG: hypothetical protein EZS28_039170 [Streblomastix strix]
MIFAIRYHSRCNTEIAWSIAEQYGRNSDIHFILLDNKIIFNEIGFQFDPKQLGNQSNIFNQQFNEQLILNDLKQKWGTDVVRVQLNFDCYGKLYGSGLITFESTISSEKHVNALIPKQIKNIKVETCGVELKCWRREGSKDLKNGFKEMNKREFIRQQSGISELIREFTLPKLKNKLKNHFI